MRGHGLVAYGMAIFQSPKIFFRGRILQEGPFNSAGRAVLTKFQAPNFEISEPEKNAIPCPQPFPTPTRLPLVGAQSKATAVLGKGDYQKKGRHEGTLKITGATSRQPLVQHSHELLKFSAYESQESQIA